MRRCDQVVAALLLLFSVGVLVSSRDLVYAVEFSPGAGFFPIWLGIVLAILSPVLLAKSSRMRASAAEESPLPGKAALTRIALILGSLLASILLFERAGFLLSMVALVAFLLIGLENYRWYSGIAISVLMVSLVFGIFRAWLGVPLPLGLLR